MARPVWRGAITFGLVTIPVELYTATEDHSFHFRQFERGTTDRVRYRRVNERTGKEIDYDDIVKGYEFDDGELVFVDRQELDQIAPGRSRSIDIDAFVNIDEVDPVYFQRSYWLAPGSQEHRHAYALLLRAMRESGRAGIARFVMRGKEYVAAVRAGDGVLALDTLLFADEVRAPEVDVSAEESKVRANEVKMAVSLIDSMSAEWNPEDYEDTYNDRVRELLEKKKQGEAVEPEPAPAEPTGVVDLFEALSRSVESRSGGSAGSARSGRSSSGRGSSGGTARGRKKSAGGKAEGAPDYSAMSKRELDRLAREYGVPRRSKLNREQLADAVAAAAGEGQAAS